MTIDPERRAVLVERYKALHELVQASLLERWDPIGIRSCPEAQDEYDSYAPLLVKVFLEHDNREENVFAYLWKIETEYMGLPGNHSHTMRYAKWLSSAVAELER